MPSINRLNFARIRTLKSPFARPSRRLTSEAQP
jgi:hypothetical protein